MDKKRDQKATDKKVKAYNKYENRAGKQNADSSKPKSEAKGKDGAPILNRR